ncbi:MAG: indole-3-glycerol phosphate synthase TrpC [Bacteroidales bacterium]
MTILNEIISHKIKEVSLVKEKVPISRLEESLYFQRNPLSFTDFLLNPDKTGIIAEFKRKSPSRGVINSLSTIEEVTTGYFRSGASALSVLTDEKFFGGTAADLMRARELNPIPILRKDFVVDEYQLIEAKSIGADAVLLIAAALDIEQTKRLARFARSLQLQVLLEVHQEDELAHLNEFVDMVGVNNRNLKTFTVDTETSVRLASQIPGSFVKVSESGITSPLTIKSLRGCGYQGFLIGENFMRTPEPAQAFSEFVKLILFDHD